MVKYVPINGGFFRLIHVYTTLCAVYWLKVLSFKGNIRSQFSVGRLINNSFLYFSSLPNISKWPAEELFPPLAVMRLMLWLDSVYIVVINTEVACVTLLVSDVCEGERIHTYLPITTYIPDSNAGEFLKTRLSLQTWRRTRCTGWFAITVNEQVKRHFLLWDQQHSVYSQAVLRQLLYTYTYLT